MIPTLIGLLAAGLAGQVNRAIYGLAWNYRPISPWSPAPPGAPPRNGWDCLPVLGWWRLRREAPWHGRGFWIRPALIELLLGVGIGWLYVFEREGGLLPIGAATADLPAIRSQFLSHACLILLMTAATFIDIDEKTIPDEITIPGTLLGVAFAGWLPHSLLPVWQPSSPPIEIDRLLASSPESWPLIWDGRRGLMIALICIACWWYALLPKTLWYRGGVVKFTRYLAVSIWRHPLSKRVHLLSLAVAAGTSICWWQASPAAWRGVLTAWIGMAVGGGIVWLVRIVGSLALRQEAMGFGDVTLMGMIGAFVGWQPSLLIFFLAPFTGVVIALTQWLLTRRKDIAYGPFLCLATLMVVVTWAEVWEQWGYPLFSLGPLLPAVLIISLLLMGAILFVKRMLDRTV